MNKTLIVGGSVTEKDGAYQMEKSAHIMLKPFFQRHKDNVSYIPVCGLQDKCQYNFTIEEIEVIPILKGWKLVDILRFL